MRLLCMIALLMLNGEAMSATLTDKDAAKNLAESVMIKVNEDDPLAAIDLIKPYTSFGEAKFNDIRAQMEKQAPAIKRAYGDTLGFELIKTTEAGESLMLLEYIQKYEIHPTYWQFYFYKPKDTWVLNVLKFDDEIKMIFGNQ